MDLGTQVEYWDTAGAAKTFTHPLEPGWLAGLGPDTRFLDYGCGYGRTLAELAGRGFTSLTGVDISPALIERGRSLSPGLSLAVLEHPPTLPHPDASFDVVLLFAVLTCVPDDAAQRALVAEVFRVLAPGGLLYVSDYVLQTDERNRTRYAAHATDAPYGVFTTDDGAVCRHHDPAALRALLTTSSSPTGPEREREFEVTTMNGHSSRGIQLLVRKHA